MRNEEFEVERGHLSPPGPCLVSMLKCDAPGAASPDAPDEHRFYWIIARQTVPYRAFDYARLIYKHSAVRDALIAPRRNVNWLLQT